MTKWSTIIIRMERDDGRYTIDRRRNSGGWIKGTKLWTFEELYDLRDEIQVLVDQMEKGKDDDRDSTDSTWGQLEKS